MTVDSSQTVLARGPRDDEQGALSDQNTQELSVLNGARNPLLRWQGSYSADPGDPANATAGVETGEVLHSLLVARLRRDANTRQSDITVNTITNTHLYRVVIDSTNCDYTSDGDATQQEILEGVRDAINAAVGATVTATVIDADGDSTDDTVKVVGDTDADYTITVVAELTLVADATTATIKLWGKVTDEEDTTRSWYDLDGVSVTYTKNTISRINTAGLSDVFVQVTAVDGTVKVGMAPCGVTVQDEGAWL